MTASPWAPQVVGPYQTTWIQPTVNAMTGHISPPISPSYDEVDQWQWVNRNDGTYVCWNSAEGHYQCYRPDLGEWFWWGAVPGHSGWIPYRRRSGLRIDFWVHSIIGLLVFVWAAAQGWPGVGAVVFMISIGIGLLMSWLRTRHPGAYTVLTVVGTVGLLLALHDRPGSSRSH